MSTDVEKLLRRARQIDVLAYILVGSLVLAVAVLLYMVLLGLRAPDTWLLANPWVRALVGALVVAFVVYMGDQHRRVRAALLDTHRRLEEAKDETTAAFERLSFAYHAAEIMTSLARSDGLRVVLAESVRHFEADAAAVVGEETTLASTDSADAAAARAAVLNAATESTGADRPLALGTGESGSSAITAPLRVRGQRIATVVIWRSAGDLGSEDLEGLSLVARILELGLDNRALLEEVKAQLSGTLKAMVDLVERRCPNYIPQSMTVASYAVAVGKALGMTDEERTDLRLAAMLHDIGMLDVPESVLSAPRRLSREEQALVWKHAQTGADLARMAKFSPSVQRAVQCHHERVDGAGYPKGLSGSEIPLDARILAVCDSYVAMISERPHRPRMSSVAAVSELRAGAGAQYDAEVVREFVKIQVGGSAEVAEEAASSA
jgi:putative nucleotidyltransferase with HDIG domain